MRYCPWRALFKHILCRDEGDIVLVILDSSVICRDFRMDGGTFRMFFEGVERGMLTISVPEIVLEEVVNKFREEVYARLKSIEQNVSHLKRIAGNDPSFVQFEMIDLERLTRECGAFLKKRFADGRANILDYPDTSHKDVVHRALSRKKPFSASGSGYRDTLIWECVLV